MAFTYTVVNTVELGNRRLVYGNYASAGGSTGGDITTGLDLVESFFLTEKDSAVMASGAVFNETLPLSGGTAITIVTTADKSGSWMAIGV